MHSRPSLPTIFVFAIGVNRTQIRRFRINLQTLPEKSFKMLWKSSVVLLCVAWALVQANVDVPPPIYPTSSSTSTTAKPNTTTAAPTTPATSTTTITPTTPTSTTTTSTTPPTTTKTTTLTPNTTTTKPTTTSTPSPPTTTTTKPTTTSTPSPPTTPKPADKPAVNNYIGNYTGRDAICLMVTMAIQVELTEKNSTLINVPKSVNYTIDCLQPDQEFLTVTWDKDSNSKFEFFKNNSKYEIKSINVTLPGDDGTTTYYHNKAEFAVSDKLSYFCAWDQPLNLTDGKTNKTLAKIHLSKVQYQAFMNTTEPHYASVWNCDSANTSDVVPVVVGCVLAVLVVLVLALYLFGRRRCQARGYLSM